MFVSCSLSFNSGNIFKEIENIFICLSNMQFEEIDSREKLDTRLMWNKRLHHHAPCARCPLRMVPLALQGHVIFELFHFVVCGLQVMYSCSLMLLQLIVTNITYLLPSIRKKLMSFTFKQIVYLAHFHRVCPPSVPTRRTSCLCL